jgi:signal transduction histidine kinase
MGFPKLGNASLALQTGALAVFAVILSNIFTIMFFTGDRTIVLRTIISMEASSTLMPLVKAVAEGRDLPSESEAIIRPVSTWQPDPQMWERSALVTDQLQQSVSPAKVEVYLPVLRSLSQIAVFRQVRRGGPQIAAIVRQDGKEPLLITTKIRPDFPPPVAALASSLLAGVLIVIGTMLLLGRMTKPLRSLALASERIGQTAAIELVPVKGPEELRHAARAFNLMAGRIAQLLDRQRGMLWALGHDLRTPVTALKIRLELVDDPETRSRLSASTDEIERVVEDALFLARTGVTYGPTQLVQLDEIVRVAVAGLVDADPDAVSRISVQENPNVSMKLAKSEMVRAVRNLIHNGLRHTTGAVHITISDKPAPMIVVEDWGAGLPASVLASPGLPFVRGDAARTSDGSTGLGLAISRSIIESHGGVLQARSKPDETGAIVSLVFLKI